MDLRLAAAIVSTAGVTATTVAASKDNYKKDYPGAAVTAKEIIVSVTHY